MSFKVALYNLVEPGFRQAVEVLWSCDQLNAETSFTAHKLRVAIKDHQKYAGKLQKDTLKKYAHLDVHGEPAFDPKTGICNFKDETGMEKFTKEYEELLKEEVVVKAKKFDFRALMEVKGLQPSVWEKLEPILENVPED